MLNYSRLSATVQTLFSYFDTDKKLDPMLARFPLQASAPNERLSRLADWWPAAIIGLLALLGGMPDGNAQTLGLF